MATLPIMGIFLAFNVVLGLCSLFLLKKLLNWHHTLRGLPPGPRGLPIIGNVFDMPGPAEKPWLHWKKFKRLYGPVSSVTMFGQTIIVLNEYDSAVELLEKNSTVFSDRASLTFAGEMVGWNRVLVFQQYGDHLRLCRRDLHKFLGTRSAIESFSSTLEGEQNKFLSKTLNDPASWREHIQRTTGSIILRLAYGYKVEKEGPDRLISLAEEVLGELTQSITPGVWAVDLLPFLRYLPEWLPGMAFKSTARKWRKHVIEFVDRPYQFTKQKMAAGIASESYVSATLSSLPSPLTAEDESRVKWVAAAIYGGGADSTATAMETFFLAMVLHPHVQREAQAEIDSVAGTDRLPNWKDREQMPYVEAVLKECLRWSVVVPMGIAHTSSKEHVYRGYRIPKGTIVMPNLWEFSHDPNTYVDPDIFNPTRFLNIDGHKPEMDPRQYIFGFGRRICPGKELADASLWLSIARSLSVFNIEKALDETGKELTPLVEYDNGSVSHPKHFPCSIVPRTEKSEELIRSMDYERPCEETDSDVLERVDWDLSGPTI